MLDWKKLVGLIVTALLGLGVGFAAKNGIEIGCPAQSQIAPAESK